MASYQAYEMRQRAKAHDGGSEGVATVEAEEEDPSVSAGHVFSIVSRQVESSYGVAMDIMEKYYNNSHSCSDESSSNNCRDSDPDKKE